MRKKIFISYCKDDRKWHDQLLKYMRPHVAAGAFPEPWSDRFIQPGDKWDDAIKTALGQTKLAVLLISPNFMASDYIISTELPILCSSADKNELAIVSISVGFASYKYQSCIASRQWANAPETPLNSLSESNLGKTWTQIIDKITEIY